MEAQEALNKVMRFAYKQNEQCLSGVKGCLYRGDNGQKCFVGHMIPDDEYSSSIEGKLAGEVLIKFPKIAAILEIEGMCNGEMMAFWEHLQGIHDGDPPKYWPGGFEEFADMYDLKIEVHPQ